MSGPTPAAASSNELCIDEHHASFAGHFPGSPILPGAVLLDAALSEIAARHGIDLTRWRLASAKFLDIVRPGAALTLAMTADDKATIRFVIRNAGRDVANGVLSAHPAEADAPHGA